MIHNIKRDMPQSSMGQGSGKNNYHLMIITVKNRLFLSKGFPLNKTVIKQKY